MMKLEVVRPVNPNSALGLSQASLWRHIGIFLKHDIEMIIECLKEGVPLVLVAFIGIIALCFPPSWPIFAWLKRGFWRKEVKKFNQ